MVPNKPGVYKMSGLVNMIDNLELPFKAKAEVKALGIRFNNYGKIVPGA
jgi:hypothetical protein